MTTPTIVFYNRIQEQAVLREAVRSAHSELVILYGRRGVGKSALLEHTLAQSGLSYIYYKATRRTLPLQLEALTESVREACPDAFLPQPFTSITVFLDFLAHRARELAIEGGNLPVVAILDELPYLADVEPGLLTIIQHWWDVNKCHPNLKLFLSGSYVAFMERDVLDASAPLYNRRTGAMRLEPMDYADAALFFPMYTAEIKMTAYAILGGIPSYLEQFDPKQSIETNVKTTVLRRNTYLSEEPDWLLLEDLRRDATNGSILRAIATGSRKPSDIARAIGKKSAQDIAPRLATLRELTLVVREVPITEKNQPHSRISLYFLADNYLDFWYRYVDPARSLVARGLGERIWERSIAPTLGEYVARPAFERACRQYLWRALAAGVLPEGLDFVDVGTWWGAGDIEIDVVATDERGRVVLAGSCKWTNAPMDMRDYATLQRNLTLAKLDGFEHTLMLFSRAGFTSRLKEFAASQEHPRLLLIDLDTMYRH